MYPSITCAPSAQISRQDWPRVALSLNPSRVIRMPLPWGAGDMLWSGGVWWNGMFTMTLDLAWMVSCILRTMRRVGPSGICWTQEQWCWSPLRRWAGALLIWSPTGSPEPQQNPWRGCAAVLFLRIPRKCNANYSCSLLKPPCISHANGVPFPGGTAPS